MTLFFFFLIYFDSFFVWLPPCLYFLWPLFPLFLFRYLFPNQIWLFVLPSSDNRVIVGHKCVYWNLTEVLCVIILGEHFVPCILAAFAYNVTSFCLTVKFYFSGTAGFGARIQQHVSPGDRPSIRRGDLCGVVLRRSRQMEKNVTFNFQADT